MRTPDYSPAPPKNPAPVGNPPDADVKKYFEPEKPAPLTTGGDIRMPYQAPPLTGTKAAEMPPMPSAPLARPTPPPFEPYGLNAPSTISPFNPERPTDYRHRVIRDEEDFERNQFMRKGAKLDEKGNVVGFKRSGKDIALNALLGAVTGLGSGQGLGGALGGAVGGATGAAVSPERGREHLFETMEAPRIRQEVQRKREEEDRAQQAAMGELKRRQIEADIASKEQGKYVNVAPGATVFDPRTKRPLYTAPMNEKIQPHWVESEDEEGNPVWRNANNPNAPTLPYHEKQRPISEQEAEAMRSQDEGTQEQIAQSYMQGRRESLKGRLSPRERDIVNGAAKNADDEEVSKAMHRWQQIQDKEMESIRKEVAQNAKTNAQKFRLGARPKTKAPMTQSSGGASGPKMKFSDLKNLLNK